MESITMFYILSILLLTFILNKINTENISKPNTDTTLIDEIFKYDIEAVDDGNLSVLELSLTPSTNETENQTSPHPVGDVVDEFLRIVERYQRNRENCVPGTTYNLGEGVVAQYGVKRFRAQAMTAVNRANFLTRIWKKGNHNGEISEYFLYSAVRSMVESDKDLFAAGNCYDYQQYNNYTLFCPYAYRLLDNREQIMVKDLSVEYMYMNKESEFFYQARVKAEQKLSKHYNVSLGYSMYRYNSTAYLGVEAEDSISILYEDGHWSKPYFDCRGGDIWMMTYTVPFFGFSPDGKYHFKGTSGIDIDLEKVDIDQCPPPDDQSTDLNVFSGSDKCKRDTTTCVPVQGLGFRRGSYKCVCKEGFYFGNTSLPAEQRYFSGSEVERQYELMAKGKSSTYSWSFSCLPCSPGCVSCENSKPCVLELNWLLRTVICAISSFMMGLLPLLIWFTHRYRHVKVLKAASPLILEIILFGAFLLYCPILVLYLEPTQLNCSLRVWFRELGFSVSYGALLLKTWRISVVFQVRSAQPVKISDYDLIKRLLIIVLAFAICLTVRMAVQRPKLVIGLSSDGLRTWQCSLDVWDYCTAVAELCFLLWGIRLSIMVRKAPSEFNESRFISWAIYNEALLSLFLNITTFFLRSPANPDLLYAVLFLHTQLTTTVTLAFLYGSKIYLIYKCRNRHPTQAVGGNENDPLNCFGNSQRGSLPARPQKYSSMSIRNSVAYKHSIPMLVTNRRVGSSNSQYYGQTMLSMDIQEEFRRLYTQLELLQIKNMMIGNPHIPAERFPGADPLSSRPILKSTAVQANGSVTSLDNLSNHITLNHVTKQGTSV